MGLDALLQIIRSRTGIYFIISDDPYRAVVVRSGSDGERQAEL